MSNESGKSSTDGITSGVPKFWGTGAKAGSIDFASWSDLIQTLFLSHDWDIFIKPDFKLEDHKPAEEKLNLDYMMGFHNVSKAVAEERRTTFEINERRWKEFEEMKRQFHKAFLALKLSLAQNSQAYKLVEGLRDDEQSPLSLWTKLNTSYGLKTGKDAPLLLAELHGHRIKGKDLTGYINHVQVLRQQIKASGEIVSDNNLKSALILALDGCPYKDISIGLKQSVLANSGDFDAVAMEVLEYDKKNKNLERIKSIGQPETKPNNNKNHQEKKQDPEVDVKALMGKVQNLQKRLKNERRKRNKFMKNKDEIKEEGNDSEPDDPKPSNGGGKNQKRKWSGGGNTPKKGKFNAFVVRVNKASVPRSDDLKFYGDTGAEAHVISGPMLKKFQEEVREARHSSSMVQFGAGPAHKADAEVDVGMLTGALVVQKADRQTNLISIGKFDDSGGAVLVQNGKMHFFPSGTVFEASEEPIMTGVREGGLYSFEADVVMQTSHLDVNDDTRPLKLCKLTTSASRYSAHSWHNALSHSVNFKKLIDMANHGSVLGLPVEMVPRFQKAIREGPPCLQCSLGVFHQYPVGRELTPSRKYGIGEYWHIDLVGPFPKSIGGNTYALVANDQESSRTHTFYVSGKEPQTVIIPTLLKLINRVRSKNKNPRFFHFDADTVFIAEEVQDFLAEKTISCGYSEPGEHRHSGAIEAIARVLEEGMRKELAAAEAKERFWAYAFSQAAYIHDRVITARFEHDPERRYKTPLEIYEGVKPDLSKVVPWGMACVNRIPNPHTLTKLEWRGRPGVTLGNAAEFNDATYVYNLKSKRVVVSKDVRVDETRMGFTGKPVNWFHSDVGPYQCDDRDVVVLDSDESPDSPDADGVAEEIALDGDPVGDDSWMAAEEGVPEAAAIQSSTTAPALATGAPTQQSRTAHNSPAGSQGRPSNPPSRVKTGPSGSGGPAARAPSTQGAPAASSKSKRVLRKEKKRKRESMMKDDRPLAGTVPNRLSSESTEGQVASAVTPSDAGTSMNYTQLKGVNASTGQQTGTVPIQPDHSSGVQAVPSAAPSVTGTTESSTRKGGLNAANTVRPGLGPYERPYRTRSDRMRANVATMSPERKEISQLIKRKLEESMARRLGETAIKLQLRDRAVERHTHRVHLANLIHNMHDEDEDDSEEFPIAQAAFRAFAAKHADDPDIPKTYEEAMSPRFRDKFGPAIAVELKRIHESGVFGSPVRRKTTKKPLGLKWIFDIKRRKDGSVERYKARLVAKGFTQVYGDSYFDTYAATPSRESLRLVVALAAKYGLQTFQGDVTTAFLYGEMEEEVYATIPDGWDGEMGEKGDVLPMLKTLYGTKQASRQWQKKMRSALESLGFTSMEADPCLYVKREGKSFIIVAVYVDDVFGTSNDSSMIDWFNEEIPKIFAYTNLGELHKFLGTWVERLPNGDMVVTAGPAIKKILIRHGIEEGQHAPESPAEPNRKLHPARPGERLLSPAQHAEYQALIGSLLFLSVSCRPDITEAVNELSRFLAAPTEPHWKAAMRVLKYLSGKLDDGLFYCKTHEPDDEIDIKLVGYSDANWADSDDRKSTSGLTIQMMADGEDAQNIQGGVLSYYSKRQACVALSSTEAEYIALSRGGQTLSWLRRLLHQLGFGDPDPTLVFEDNTSAIHIAEGEGLNQRTKHIDVRHHYIRDLITNGIIEVDHIGTEVMIADFFTKPLPVHRFVSLKKRIMR